MEKRLIILVFNAVELVEGFFEERQFEVKLRQLEDDGFIATGSPDAAEEELFHARIRLPIFDIVVNLTQIQLGRQLTEKPGKRGFAMV